MLRGAFFGAGFGPGSELMCVGLDGKNPSGPNCLLPKFTTAGVTTVGIVAETHYGTPSKPAHAAVLVMPYGKRDHLVDTTAFSQQTKRSGVRLVATALRGAIARRCV